MWDAERVHGFRLRADEVRRLRAPRADALEERAALPGVPAKRADALRGQRSLALLEAADASRSS